MSNARSQENESISAANSLQSLEQQSTASTQIACDDINRHGSTATGETGQHLWRHAKASSSASKGEQSHQHGGDAFNTSSQPAKRDIEPSFADPVSRTTNDTAVWCSMNARLEVEGMRKKRNAIRRQLRLLFIYPVVHFVTWVGPLVQHITFYYSQYAARPIFGVGMWAYFSYAILGFVDALVFCLREKPWRHIPGSDGTLLSALKFWQQDYSERARAARSMAAANAYGSRRDSSVDVSPTRRLSGEVRAKSHQRHFQQRLRQDPEMGVSAHAVESPHRDIQGMAAWDFGR
ncbi:MAG: hypothetical protein Q9159_005782 [Coniocarpon cinnabarinum]